MSGLKGKIETGIRKLQTIWYGDPQKQMESQCDRHIRDLRYQELKKVTTDGRLTSERNKIDEYKTKFECRMLKEQVDSFQGLPVKSQVFQKSNVQEINIAILEWFREKWIKNGTEDEIRFYLWLESVYNEHLKAHEKNKKGHFKDNRKKSGYESAIGTGKKIGSVLKAAVALGSGAAYLTLLKYIYNYIGNMEVWKAFPNWLGGALFVTVGIVIALLFLLVIKLVLGLEYTTRIVKLEDRRETWLRHTEAIMGYQKELIEYLFDMGEYHIYACQADKDNLLKKRLWKCGKEIWKVLQQI